MLKITFSLLCCSELFCLSLARKLRFRDERKHGGMKSTFIFKDCRKLKKIYNKQLFVITALRQRILFQHEASTFEFVEQVLN